MEATNMFQFGEEMHHLSFIRSLHSHLCCSSAKHNRKPPRGARAVHCAGQWEEQIKGWRRVDRWENNRERASAIAKEAVSGELCCSFLLLVHDTLDPPAKGVLNL